MSRAAEFTKGLIKENPVLILLLGLCPTLAITTSVQNAVGMGLSATFVLISSNVIVSLFSKMFPKQIRIPCYIVVIATFVTIVKMILAAYIPALNDSLGIFIPLIVVNCVILGRAEAFASKRGAVDSLIDALGMGAGFTGALVLVALIREVGGAWQLWGVPITNAGPKPIGILVMAPGAFIVLGLVLAYLTQKANKSEQKNQLLLATVQAKAFEEARPTKPEKLVKATPPNKETANNNSDTPNTSQDQVSRDHPTEGAK